MIFLHGWGGMDPTIYGAWMRHLVRRGNIVLYPRYQAGLRTRPAEMAGHAVAAIRDAIERLEREGPVQPDLDKVALVGHSMGAILSANIAQRASKLALPRARAIFAAEPAFEPILGAYDQIPASTLLLVVVGADAKRDASAHRILEGSSLIPSENKEYVVLPSDHYGSPPLISDHFSPCAAQRLDGHSDTQRHTWRGHTLDALDYYGYWKLCDALLDAAFFNTNREYALGSSPQQRSMGIWSDGTPVREAMVVDGSRGWPGGGH